MDRPDLVECFGPIQITNKWVQRILEYIMRCNTHCKFFTDIKGIEHGWRRVIYIHDKLQIRARKYEYDKKYDIANTCNDDIYIKFLHTRDDIYLETLFEYMTIRNPEFEALFHDPYYTLNDITVTDAITILNDIKTKSVPSIDICKSLKDSIAPFKTTHPLVWHIITHIISNKDVYYKSETERDVSQSMYDELAHYDHLHHIAYNTEYGLYSIGDNDLIFAYLCTRDTSYLETLYAYVACENFNLKMRLDLDNILKTNDKPRAINMLQQMLGG